MFMETVSCVERLKGLDLSVTSSCKDPNLCAVKV